MNLIIDIGNTLTKVGLFDATRLVKKLSWQEWDLDQLKALVRQKNVQHVAVSSVAHLEEKVERYLQKHFFYLNLNAETPIPIKNLYKTPKTLGKDRLAAVVGATALFPGENNLVIDAGTCIKYDLINAKGQYFGGSISPGMDMRFRAMNAFTARLPLIERGALRSLIGRDTQTAMQTGTQWGVIFEIEGFIRQYGERFGQINVILTGGSANYFAKKLKTQIFVNHHLVLIGLNKILNYNVQLLE
ncbi:MAG: type III pantothenate kinase [Bacteroidota bacterium]